MENTNNTTNKEVTLGDKIEAQWHNVRGKIQEKWGELTNNELQEAKGNYKQLVATIKKRTGASVEKIEEVLAEITEENYKHSQNKVV